MPVAAVTVTLGPSSSNRIWPEMSAVFDTAWSLSPSFTVTFTPRLPVTSWIVSS